MSGKEIIVFKPGDKLICVDSEGSTQSDKYPRLGEIVTFINVVKDHSHILIKEMNRSTNPDANDVQKGYSPSRFKLYKRRTYKNMKGEVSGGNL